MPLSCDKCFGERYFCLWRAPPISLSPPRPLHVHSFRVARLLPGGAVRGYHSTPRPATTRSSSSFWFRSDCLLLITLCVDFFYYIVEMVRNNLPRSRWSAILKAPPHLLEAADGRPAANGNDEAGPAETGLHGAEQAGAGDGTVAWPKVSSGRH